MPEGCKIFVNGTIRFGTNPAIHSWMRQIGRIVNKQIFFLWLKDKLTIWMYRTMIFGGPIALLLIIYLPVKKQIVNILL